MHQWPDICLWLLPALLYCLTSLLHLASRMAYHITLSICLRRKRSIKLPSLGYCSHTRLQAGLWASSPHFSQIGLNRNQLVISGTQSSGWGLSLLPPHPWGIAPVSRDGLHLLGRWDGMCPNLWTSLTCTPQTPYIFTGLAQGSLWFCLCFCFVQGHKWEGLWNEEKAF